MKIGIIGVGVFSLAIAERLSQKKENNIVMWSENKELVDNYQISNKVETLYKNKIFSKQIKLTNSYDEVIKDIDCLFILTSIPYVWEVCQSLVGKLNKNIPICVGTKGIYGDNHAFAYQTIKGILKNPIAILGGPTFALDIINNEPIGFTIACRGQKNKALFEKLFALPGIKVTFNSDFIGVATSGSIKNIYAIGSGIIDGLGYHESTKSYYLTLVFQEFLNVLYCLKGDLSTLHGFAGIGDLIGTCSSVNSRNYQLGVMIGEKKTKKEIVSFKEKNTIEGVHALQHILSLLKDKDKFPILLSLYKIVFEGEEAKTLLKTMDNIKLTIIY